VPIFHIQYISEPSSTNSLRIPLCKSILHVHRLCPIQQLCFQNLKENSEMKPQFHASIICSKCWDQGHYCVQQVIQICMYHGKFFVNTSKKIKTNKIHLFKLKLSYTQFNSFLYEVLCVTHA